MSKYMGIFGIIFIIGLCFFLSESKRKINWKTIASGIFLQVIFGVIILKTNLGNYFFDSVNKLFSGIIAYSLEGGSFIFGELADFSKFGFIFAIGVIPSIVFMSALMSVLYHLKIMDKIITFFAKIMSKMMGTSGAESLAAAANVFSGQTEAPLVVKPYIKEMTRSEIMALMTGGMATVAGSVFAAYVGMGIDAGHLLAASVMSAPASLLCAKLLVPETEVSKTLGKTEKIDQKKYVNIIEAASSGASDGLKLAINVVAMLLAFISLIALFNGLLGYIGEFISVKNLSLEMIFGYLFSPVAFLLGIDWIDCQAVGVLLGKKLVLNEFIAYQDLQQHIVENSLSERSIIISTYALCGFANFGSVAVQVGGLGSLVPERKSDFARLGIKCLIGGTMACLMTGALAGLLI